MWVADEEARLAAALGLEVGVELVIQLVVDKAKRAQRRLPLRVEVSKTFRCRSA